MRQRLIQIDMARICRLCLLLPLFSFILATGLFVTPAHATDVYDLPSLSSGEPTWVIDRADVLSRVNEGNLSAALKKLAQTTGKEVRMVTIRRLDYGDTIESFTGKLFETWFPTSEVQANQILLVLDTLTNTTAIQTGEAVKKIMPDEIAQSVAAETVGVQLRQGDKYNQAFLDASDRLVAVLSGKPDPGPPVIQEQINTEGTFTAAEETDKGSATVWVIGLLIAATVIPMVTYFFYVGGFSN